MFRPSFFLSNDWAFCTLSLLTVYTIPILFHCHLVLLSSGCDQSFILIKVALFITNYSWLERISEVKYRKVNLKGSFNIFQYFEGEQKQNCYRLKSQCMKPAQSLATVRQTLRQARGRWEKKPGSLSTNVYTAGSGGTQQMFTCIRAGSATRSNSSHFKLCTIFHEKGTPFEYLLLTNGIPFTYLVQNFASLLTAVNALSFKQESITKIERFLDFIKP